MFYINSQTGSVKSKSLIIDEFIKSRGFENRFDFLKESWVEHTEYYPCLYKFEIIELPIVLGGGEFEFGKKKYFNVPTEFILENLDNSEIWQGCPNLFNNDIFDIIKSNEECGVYNYNSTVGNKFLEKFKISADLEGLDFLKSCVYTTQSYNHSDKEYKKTFNMMNKLIENGWERLKESDLEWISKQNGWFDVIMSGYNLMGDEVLSSGGKFKLKSVGGKFYWVKPRVRKSGYPTKIGQFYKKI